jgi:hypothetical protein
MCVVTLTAASATTVVPMNLDDMAKASPDIVHGTVVATASHWNEDKTLIVTDVRIRVEDTLKGNAGGEITVTQPGGVVGALRVEIPGVTAFRQDQEAVLFLGPQKNGNYAVTGLMQGQFDVVTDAKTGQRTDRARSFRREARHGQQSSAAEQEWHGIARCVQGAYQEHRARAGRRPRRIAAPPEDTRA